MGFFIAFWCRILFPAELWLSYVVLVLILNELNRFFKSDENLLCFAGLLDIDDPMIMGEEDEVLIELQKRQEELKALYAHNRSQKQRLISLAKEEMKRQDLRQKLRAADSEVKT